MEKNTGIDPGPCLSSQSRDKKAIEGDIQAAYDELDKSLDLAGTVMECLKINLKTGAYKEASTVSSVSSRLRATEASLWI